MSTQRIAPEIRFWRKVQKTDGCWLWLGSKTKGYGRFMVTPSPLLTMPAHRYAYQLLVNPVPRHLVIDHLCRNKACVNPAHLEPVESRVNVARGVSPTAQNKLKATCKNGHEFSGFNLISYFRDGFPVRACRECDRARKRKFKAAIRSKLKGGGG